ncbi:type IV pilus assembly protein PilY1 [Desulfonauticus submarinus]|uniref:Type IV pilus assembly protein PilY1 n=1 Tax=Desulfonauticus submarinus TaxID=206665 RepID=A0A1G9ZK31_9BACT|nr:hypothetical protein [Desulfonauticus submarinus]SDN21852.1 type IV pilus assembly protein PilY1 [Desulfonauticus submarinus]
MFKINKLILIIGCLGLFLMPVLTWATMSDYCATPPFLSASVKPNILFVIDKSGSMAWLAYGNAYDSSETYEGYFIPTKNYKKIDGVWQETNDPESCSFTQAARTYVSGRSISGVCSGSKLNFARMARIDLLRWAITGGRPDSCGGVTDKDCDPDLACTGSYCTLKTNYGVLVKVPTSRIDGLVQRLREEKPESRPRLGVLFYSTYIYPDKVYIGDYPNGGEADTDHPYTYFTRYINAINPGGYTATSPAMWEAYDYFKQHNDHRYSNGFLMKDSSHLFRDPLYVCDANKQNCEFVPCAKNFIILASDGQWNVGGNPIIRTCSINTNFENYSADPVVPAYRVHADVLRQANGIDVNVNKVYSLGLFLGGTGELSLKNVAMYGSFDTSGNKRWPGNKSGYPFDVCFMDDCGNGAGSACTNLPPSSYDWDTDGNGEPDTFFNAKTASEIKDTITAFIQAILKEASSGTSVSVLSEKRKQGALIHQAVFYPQKRFFDANGTSKKVDWIGNIFTYWFLNTKEAQNIREDTDQDKILTVLSDNILGFSVDNQTGELTINVYNSSANGSADVQVGSYSALEEIKTLINVGKVLELTSADDRKIYGAYTDTEMAEFTVANKTKFQNLLYQDSSKVDSCLTSSGDVAENIIKYIRGEDISGCRVRRMANGVWKLGDIIYSTPAVVNYGEYGVIFTGSNDGMLHAFKVGKTRADGLSKGQVVKLCDDSSAVCQTVELGKELWAFIPKNAMPYLRYLADPDYPSCHLYYVDMPPYIIEMGSKTILIGGMRLGGGCGASGSDVVHPPSDVCSDPASSSCVGRSSYFALDITDPTTPKFLWEFSNKDLGFTYSGPAHIKYGGNHYIIFASGPTSYRGDVEQDLKIFVLKLTSEGKIALNYPKTINIAQKIPYFANSFAGRLFSEGIDMDSSGRKNGSSDYLYLGVNKKDGSSWVGNLLLIKINNDNPEYWGYEKVFNTDLEPVVSKVEYMKCFDKNFIYFGTGRWFYKEDSPGSGSSDVNSLYGVRIDDCIQNDNCEVSSIVETPADACHSIDTNDLGFAWRKKLDPESGGYFKERMISDPAVASDYDVVFFATTEPNGDVCSFGGRSRLWGLNCISGAGLTQDCNGKYKPKAFDKTVYLQLSKGNIEQIKKDDLGADGSSGWFTGVTPETAPIIPPSPGGKVGKILLWIEK